MREEDLVGNAMNIILHAGEARTTVMKALDALSLADEVSAKSLLETAQKQITKAHQVHTDTIQKEAAGESIPYSPLFSHAQDTLMTIYSELNIAKQLLRIFSALDQRVKQLEQKTGA
ncbi:MAG: PTS lactose/cellobiose transporter subunit IIA [Erysipelotrichaceae bacterium]|jgi:PTS system cellobiose-specific IIA component|nr:PTS lactose/cellobiose transporter subunit IIA [Erysipelotrichaceae bacterium]